MHLILSIVEVLALLEVLTSQPWNHNFYSTMPELPYPFREYGYDNYVTPFPYTNADPYFQYRAGRIFNGQGENDLIGLASTQIPNEVFPNFEISNNQLVKAAAEVFPGNDVNTFGPIPYFPQTSNSMVSVPDQQQQWPESGTGLMFQAYNGIPESIKSINNVPFFQEWEWTRDSQAWPQFPNSPANIENILRNDYERKTSSSLPLEYFDSYATIANGGELSASRYVPTFTPAQSNNIQTELNKYGNPPISADIQVYENKLYNQRELEGFGPMMIPFHYQREILPFLPEYPITPQTIPISKNIEQQNLNLLADASSTNLWPSRQSDVQYDLNVINQVPTTEDFSHNEIKNIDLLGKSYSPFKQSFLSSSEYPITPQTIPINKNIEQQNLNLLADASSRNLWPSHQSDVQYDLNIINQVPTTEDFSHNEIKNIDLLGKSYSPFKQSFPSSPDSPTSPDYSSEIRDENLYKSFVGRDGFPLQHQMNEGYSKSNEETVKTSDGLYDSPAFRENSQKIDENVEINSQTLITEEYQQEFVKYDTTGEQDGYRREKLSSANEAEKKIILLKIMLETSIKFCENLKDEVLPNIEPFKNIIDESVHGLSIDSFQNKLTLKESLTNSWDPFNEDRHPENEISFEKKLLSDFSPSYQVNDDLKKEEQFIPVFAPGTDAPIPFMIQIKLLEAREGDYSQMNLYYFDSTEVKNSNLKVAIDALIGTILFAVEDDTSFVMMNSTVFEKIIQFLAATNEKPQPPEAEVAQTVGFMGIKVVSANKLLKDSEINDEDDRKLLKGLKEYLQQKKDPTKVSGEEKMLGVIEEVS